jgi:hypothetical protein
LIKAKDNWYCAMHPTFSGNPFPGKYASLWNGNWNVVDTLKKCRGIATLELWVSFGYSYQVSSN